MTTKSSAVNLTTRAALAHSSKVVLPIEHGIWSFFFQSSLLPFSFLSSLSRNSRHDDLAPGCLLRASTRQSTHTFDATRPKFMWFKKIKTAENQMPMTQGSPPGSPPHHRHLRTSHPQVEAAWAVVQGVVEKRVALDTKPMGAPRALEPTVVGSKATCGAAACAGCR